tara:strand:+ start:2327 stop:2596 length:270 start_codon:yes stop_codon:yes gene_type:complete
MATTTFESLRWLAPMIIKSFKNKKHSKVQKSKFEDIRNMKREELREYINSVRSSKAFEHVKENRYSPEEYLQVSKMDYANNLLRIKRQV